MRFLLLLATVSLLLTGTALADVHIIVISEFYTQCDDGSTDVQFIELKSVSSGQFFRQCATLQVKRTVGGNDVFLADPVFAGRADGQSFANGKTWLIGTPAFQTVTGVTPNILMPNGTLDPAGGVIRFAADAGCPLFNWGTIHEVAYGDQGAVAGPGNNQSQNYNDRSHAWSVGTPSPMNFGGSTENTWTCVVVPVEETTWSRIKALYSNSRNSRS